MSDFINTVDVIGEEELIKRLLEGTLVDFKDNIIKTLGVGAFSSTPLETIDCPMLEITGSLALGGCKNLKSVNLPNLREMGDTFNSCSLKSIVLPSLTIINSKGFANSHSLETIDLPVIESIGYGTFNGGGLKTLILRTPTMAVAQRQDTFSVNACYHFSGTYHKTYNPDSLKDGYIYVPRALVEDYKVATNWTVVGEDRWRAIEDYTLSGTTSGTVVLEDTTEIFDDIVTKIENGRFANNTALVSVDLPQVTLIGTSAFSGCSSLKEVNLPLVIGVTADGFADCTSLESISLPTALVIGANGFQYCTSLKEIYVPEVTDACNQSFVSCTSLEVVDFPKVIRIGSEVFLLSTALHTLILRSPTLCNLSDINTFDSTPIGVGYGYIYVPKALISVYKTATNWSAFANQFRALEDYTVDGTVKGKLDPNKI